MRKENMANERLTKFCNDKTKVSLKTYDNKLYYGKIVYIDKHFVELNTHSNVVERFELNEVLYIDKEKS
jgi:small nuclear ribonucleoprotein (snRNP)-like protein